MKKVENNKFKFRMNDKVKVLDDIWGYNTTNKVGIIKHFDIPENIFLNAFHGQYLYTHINLVLDSLGTCKLFTFLKILI